MLTEDIQPADSHDSINTLYREQCVQKIRNMPGSLDDNVTYIFQCYPAELADYVSSKGEVPYKKNIVKLAAQACLLRAQEIAMKAKAFGVTDPEALKLLELNESAAMGINAPDVYAQLPYLVQAAIVIALGEAAMPTNGTMSSLIEMLKGGYTSNVNGFEDTSFTTRSLMNNADGDGDEDGDWFPINVGNTELADTGGIGVPGTITIAGATNTSALAPSGGTTAGANSGGGILGFLGSIVTGAQAIAGAATSVAGSTNSTVTGINKLLGNVGGQSLASYLNNNKGLVAIWAIGIILVIIIIAYVSKNSGR